MKKSTKKRWYDVVILLLNMIALILLAFYPEKNHGEVMIGMDLGLIIKLLWNIAVAKDED